MDRELGYLVGLTIGVVSEKCGFGCSKVSKLSRVRRREPMCKNVYVCRESNSFCPGPGLLPLVSRKEVEKLKVIQFFPSLGPDHLYPACTQEDGCAVDLKVVRKKIKSLME